jgi:hypothetical protein
MWCDIGQFFLKLHFVNPSFNLRPLLTYIKSNCKCHVLGESTHYGGGQKCCHIILFSKGVHV